MISPDIRLGDRISRRMEGVEKNSSTPAWWCMSIPCGAISPSAFSSPSGRSAKATLPDSGRKVP